MEKLAYLLWNDATPNADAASPIDAAPDAHVASPIDVRRDAYRDRLLAELPEAMAAAGAKQLKIVVTDSDVAKGAALHLGPLAPDALVTFWLECCQDRRAAEASLVACGRLAGYLVVESHPLRVETPDGGIGKRMQGFCLVGCIEPKSGVSQADFVGIWESVHRDVAIETQSTFSYVRNEIVRPLTRDAPTWGGIVEEGFPIEALENPQAFYDAVGDEAKYQRNLKRMMDSVNAFLSMEKVDSHPMSEYRFY